jgi:hypothetical protein
VAGKGKREVILGRNLFPRSPVGMPSSTLGVVLGHGQADRKRTPERPGRHSHGGPWERVGIGSSGRSKMRGALEWPGKGKMTRSASSGTIGMATLSSSKIASLSMNNRVGKAAWSRRLCPHILPGQPNTTSSIVISLIGSASDRATRAPGARPSGGRVLGGIPGGRSPPDQISGPPSGRDGGDRRHVVELDEFVDRHLRHQLRAGRIVRRIIADFRARP